MNVPSALRRLLGRRAMVAKSGTMMTVTLQEAVDAIVKNGLPKARVWEKHDSNGKLTGACSIAQGAINLGCTYASLEKALKEIYVFNGGAREMTLSSYIIRINDSTPKSVEDIGKEAARRVKALPNLPLTVSAR